MIRLACLLVCVDAAAKLLLPTQPWAQHGRSLGWLIAGVVGCLLFGWAATVRPVALPASLLAAGTAGNVLFALAGPVPNPFLFQADGIMVAFNVADVSLVAGAVLLVLMLPRLVAGGLLARRAA